MCVPPDTAMELVPSRRNDISQLHLLLVSPDSSLSDELQNALHALPQEQVVVHVARDLARAVDLARSRHPALAIVEMTDHLETLRTFAVELRAVAPQLMLAATYRAEAFAPETWERTSEGAIFVEGVRAGFQDFLRRPLATGDLRQLLVRLHHGDEVNPQPPGKVITFISNKGGVGKSTLAVNTACRLAQRHPEQVLLIDCSLQMGLCAPMLDLRPKTSLLDAVHERHRLDPMLIRQLATPHVSGLDLLAAPPDALAATAINDEILVHVLTLARRTYRYVVVDTFPLFDRVIMATLDVADRAFIVLDNIVPTVLSAARLLQLMDNLAHPAERRRVVVNRFSHVAGNPTLDDIERSLNRKVDHVLPFDRRVMTAANLGQPYALSPRWWSGTERGLREIVTEIEQEGPNPQASVAGEIASHQIPSSTGNGSLNVMPTATGELAHGRS